MIKRSTRITPPPYSPLKVPETSEMRTITALLYLGVLVLLAGLPHLACRPQSLQLASGRITIVYPLIAIEGFPLKISVHIRHGETVGPCDQVWPQLETRNGYIRWIPEETSPSERGRSQEGAARTAFPVFEYTGVIQGMHASWEEVFIQYSERCEVSDLICRGQNATKKSIRIYILDLPLPPAFVQALIEGWKYIGVAWLLILSSMPALLFLPNELREKILGAIVR